MNTFKVSANLPTEYGTFNIIAFDGGDNCQPHLALVHEECNLQSIVPVRLHSECLTGDVFKSKRCDCGEQLDLSLKYLAKNKGVLLYLRQEGRGIGLINKLKAYNLQDEGLDTFDANEHLGFQPDERDFTIAINILEELGIKDIDLITNNPDKMEIFNNAKVKLHNRISISVTITDDNEKYLLAKRNMKGHLISFYEKKEI
ncbi:MAG: GTP cyclohydrolase II [Saprospiraceae bacterium]